MKREVDVMPQLLFATYRILVVIVLVLVLALAFGTVIGLTARSAPGKPGQDRSREAGEQGSSRRTDVRRTDARQTELSRTGAEKPKPQAYFTGVGRVRAPTSDAPPATVIVSIAFPYDRNDSAFSEELAARTRDFRALAVELFSSYSGARLRAMGEAELKTELLARYNDILRLGKIDTLYFNDYLIVD